MRACLLCGPSGKQRARGSQAPAPWPRVTSPAAPIPPSCHPAFQSRPRAPLKMSCLPLQPIVSDCWFN